jgi:hypothetical protein
LPFSTWSADTVTTPPRYSAPSTCSNSTAEDLRPSPIEEHKRILAKLLIHPHEGIAFNEQYAADGAIIFKDACALGCKGIVSKRLGSSYRSGCANYWAKIKTRTRQDASRDRGRLGPMQHLSGWEASRLSLLALTLFGTCHHALHTGIISSPEQACRRHCGAATIKIFFMLQEYSTVALSPEGYRR